MKFSSKPKPRFTWNARRNCWIDRSGRSVTDKRRRRSPTLTLRDRAIQMLSTAQSRARTSGQEPELSQEQWLASLEHFGWACAYCTLRFDDTPRSFSLDHVVPMSLGGKTAAANCVPACTACNMRKARDPRRPDFWTQFPVGAKERVLGWIRAAEGEGQ